MEQKELRIYTSLVHEAQADTVEEIRIELFGGPGLAAEDVEEAVRGLAARGWAEEFAPGRWKLTPNGHGKKPSVLGLQR